MVARGESLGAGRGTRNAQNCRPSVGLPGRSAHGPAAIAADVGSDRQWLGLPSSGPAILVRRRPPQAQPALNRLPGWDIHSRPPRSEGTATTGRAWTCTLADLLRRTGIWAVYFVIAISG